MYQGGTYLRGLWKHPVKQYGPWKVVHESLKRNLESNMIGIDSNTLLNALNLTWPVTTFVPDFAKAIHGVNNNASFKNNLLNFGTNSQVVVSGLPIPDNWTILIITAADSTTTGQYVSDFFGGADSNNAAIIKGFQSGFYNIFGAAYPTGTAADSQIPMSGNGIKDVVVWNKKSTAMAGFVNGLKEKSFVQSSGDFNLRAGLKIGSSGADSNYYSGDIFCYMVFSDTYSDAKTSLLSELSNLIWQPNIAPFYSLGADTGLTKAVAGTLPAMSGDLTIASSFNRTLEGSI